MDISSSANNRREARSNIFVMAALYTGGASTAVRIRNMSRTGALIEGAALPPAGAQVRLSRGSISVTGEVMWIDKQKAGVRFNAPTTPNEWVPGGKRGAGQQMADELAHQMRLGGAAPNMDPPVSIPSPQLSDELLRLHQVLMRAGEQLALDDAVAVNHLIALQAIDGVAQTLARIADETSAPMPRRAP